MLDLRLLAAAALLPAAAFFQRVYHLAGHIVFIMLGQDTLGGKLLTLQIAFSNWWLRHHHFGPFEWAWKSLTYQQRQPLRRR